jgi:hypothetical protein
MKKIALIVNLLLLLTGMSFSQTTPATAQKPKTQTAKTATPAAGPTKKDGTPDMRYKANKNAAKPQTTHLKKDGTPDQRFKENKTAPAPKKTS